MNFLYYRLLKNVKIKLISKMRTIRNFLLMTLASLLLSSILLHNVTLAAEEKDEIHDIEKFADLKQVFQEDAGHVRLIAILSPT